MQVSSIKHRKIKNSLQYKNIDLILQEVEKRSPMFKMTLPVVLILSACSANQSIEKQPYDKYRHYDVQVSQAGGASCDALSSGELASAAAATSSVRASRGLGPVRVNAKLTRIAQQQACHMAKTGLMSHAGASNEGPKQRAKSVGYQPTIIAENIAAGPYSLQQVLAAWTSSPGHITNISLPAVNDFGIGVAVGADGTRYWAAVYADHK